MIIFFHFNNKGRVSYMIGFYLKVIPRGRMGKSDRKELYAEYQHRSNRIYIYLFNLTKPFRWVRFIKQFNALVNHEMTHFFLKNIRGSEMKKERIAELMECERIKW